MSLGISIKNIHNIILVESFKSYTLVAQSIGRGLREHPDKQNLMIYDLADDLRTEDWQNYGYRHFKERKKIYQKEGFPFSVKKINI